MRRFDDVLRLRHLCSRSVGDQQELICLECCFVLYNAVLGNSYAIEASSQSTQRSYLHCTFQPCHDPCNDRSRRQDWAETRNHEKSRAEQKPPEASPERANFAPILHAVASVVIAHRMLIRMV